MSNKTKTFFKQGYVRKLNRAVATGRLPLVPGSVGVVEVRHDPWCPKLRGGQCECNPELEVKWR